MQVPPLEHHSLEKVFFFSRPLPPVLSFLPSHPAGSLRIQDMLTGDETAPPTPLTLSGGRRQRWPACCLSLPPSGSLAPETGDFREISGDPWPPPGSSPLLPSPLQTAQAWFPEGGGVQREVTFRRPVDLQGGAGEGGEGFGVERLFPSPSGHMVPLPILEAPAGAGNGTSGGCPFAEPELLAVPTDPADS